MTTTIKYNPVGVTEVITPETAAEYLKHNTFNRPLNNRNINILAKQMKEGKWKQNGESISFSITGDLLDGQHRLHAIIKAGVPVAMLVVRGCDPTSQPTIDSSGGRLDRDVFAMSGTNNYICISAVVNKYLTLCFNENPFSADKHAPNRLKSDHNVTRQEKLDEYFASPQLYQDAARLGANCSRMLRIMSKATIAGLAVFLIKHNGHSWEDVEAFFTQLFYGEKFTNNTIRLLRERLIRDLSAKIRMTRAIKQALITKTWNAYVRGKELNVLIYNAEKEGKLSFL